MAISTASQSKMLVFPHPVKKEECDTIKRHLAKEAGTLLGDRPIEEWVKHLSKQEHNEKLLIDSLDNLVTSGLWEPNPAVAPFIDGLVAELNRRKCSKEAKRRIGFIQSAYQMAQNEVRKCRFEKLKETSLDGAPRTILRPHFTVVCFSTSKKKLKPLKAEIEKWRDQAWKKELLADTLVHLGVLSHEKYVLTHDSNDIVKLFLEHMPRQASKRKEVYAAYDDKKVLQGVAMCKNEGKKGYHLTFPVTAPRNVEVLCCDQEITRGSVTAIIKELAKDVLEKIRAGDKKTAPRLFCYPSASARGFYKKLGFTEAKPLPKQEGSSAATDSDSDEDAARETLEMNQDALTKFVA